MKSQNRDSCFADGVCLQLHFFYQLHDFAKLNENVFYVYKDIEHFKDEPQNISITCEEDIHVTEEVYKRPVFTMPTYRCHTISDRCYLLTETL